MPLGNFRPSRLRGKPLLLGPENRLTEASRGRPAGRDRCLVARRAPWGLTFTVIACSATCSFCSCKAYWDCYREAFSFFHPSAFDQDFSKTALVGATGRLVLLTDFLRKVFRHSVFSRSWLCLLAP
jgi:hypothetical protein